MTSSLPPFVDIEWCEDRPREIVMADVRWYLDGASGRSAYEAGHIPGAVFMDLDRWLSAEPSREAGRNPLPDPEVFAEGMRNAGISDADTVVAYDDAGGVIAARLVWMLRSTGHQAALLNGGLAAYTGELETHQRARQPGRFTATPWPFQLLASIQDTAPGQGKIVVDARNRDRYEGRQDPIDPRLGHIPQAINLPCRENLDPSGKLLAKELLHSKVAGVGILSANDVISYCGSRRHRLPQRAGPGTSRPGQGAPLRRRVVPVWARHPTAGGNRLKKTAGPTSFFPISPSGTSVP
ncbi:sulfurtransferase [Arthrobacter globiformis]|uniref:sulfurtransferase n=1 Tax=Arthrobacter globiformis TaxID=1665 RepID=UPI00278DD1C9|nr:rhodanese-like domain-containing protein [Arthrobacter globiformis]MDQ0620186.1 thiosulfate/3-mercaptopyruvate sulfurtransferase [Arthrobacter globiformis]